MSESGFHRPRRAFAHGTDSDEPIAADDTGVSPSSPARRGVDPQPSEPPASTDAGHEVVGANKDAVETSDPPDEQGDLPDALAGDAPLQENPFARPGSSSAVSAQTPAPAPLVPAPVPVLPVQDFEESETAGSGRRMAGTADGPTPQPRRSAVSSATPPEAVETDPPEEAVGPASWVQHHRKTLLIWGIGALVAALLIVFGFYLAGRQGSTEPSTSPSPTASPSTSVSPVAPVTAEDLITEEDADLIVPGASWTIAQTAQSRDDLQGSVLCLGSDPTDVNPTDTYQRTMGTSEDTKLAALHQIDVYANAGAARQVQLQRAENLAACSEIPAYIDSATTVTGLGDDVTQVTVALQDDPTAFHTVLLVRTGRALTMLDVTRNAEAVEAQPTVSGVVRSLDDLCSRVDGMCPSEPEATPTVPPAVDPVGWLIESDLPRLSPGTGRWTATEPADVTSKGMGCENMTLATEAGPTARQQRTYLLTQDDATPETFGIDEMVFNFDDNTNARAFTTKLIDSLLSCKDRVETATVTDGAAVNGEGADGVAVSARIITIDQATSDDAAVRYQLVVAIGDTRVSYLLATVTDSYQFSRGQLNALALRTAQRNSQGNGDG